MAIIGIDLGTTNSLAAVWRNGRSELIPNASGEHLTPSAVSIDDDGTVLVGRAARDRLITHPDRTAAHFKRRMGTKHKYHLAGKSFTPEELSSFVLRSLREDAEAYLGEPVTEAVVSVPAYFSESQRAATKRAAALAGLKVERLINEPSAAAVAGHIGEGAEDKVCMVFDLGGGTLDVSLVERFENVVSVTAVSGDNHLGGQDFDLALERSQIKARQLAVIYSVGFYTSVDQSQICRPQSGKGAFPKFKPRSDLHLVHIVHLTNCHSVCQGRYSVSSAPLSAAPGCRL